MQEPAIISIRNLRKYQRYTTRNPPWVKLHRKILDNPHFKKLPPDQKWAFCGLILMAPQFDNRIPWNPDWITEKIGVTPDLSMLSHFIAHESAQVYAHKSTHENAPGREERGEVQSTATTTTSPTPKRRALSKAQFKAKWIGSEAHKFYGWWCEQVKDLFEVPYPDPPVACVKQTKDYMGRTSPAVVRKAGERHWLEVKKATYAEWKGTGPPPMGSKPSVKLSWFLSRLAVEMSNNGTHYRKLMDEDVAIFQTAWADSHGGLFT